MEGSKRPSGSRRLVATELLVAEVAVVAIDELTPTFRRVTFGGDELEAYSARLPADVFRLLIPPPGHDLPVMASYDDDGMPFWPEGVPRPILRTHTVRSFDEIANRLTSDIGRWGGSPAWVDTVELGDRLLLVGFRNGVTIPSTADRVILVGDTSSIPGITAVLDHRMATADAPPFSVLVEAATEADADLVRTAAAGHDVAVHVVVGGCSHGSGSALARDLAQQLRTGALRPPTSRTVVRIAAERDVARELRSLLIHSAPEPVLDHRTVVQWQFGLDATERDARLLPAFRRSALAGRDLADLDVIEALDLGHPLPPAHTSTHEEP